MTTTTSPLNALSTDTPDTTEKETQFPTGKTATPKGPYALPTGGTLSGVDPALLENMQKMIADREAQKNSFMESMRDANAWWSGGVAGPGEALARRAKEREEFEGTTFGMKSQIAQYKAQQDLAKRTQADVMSALGGSAPGAPGAAGGAGGFGTQIDPAMAKQISDLAQTDPAAARKLLQDHTKKMAEITANARMNKDSYAKVIEVRRADGKLDTVSLMELLNNPQKYQPTESGAAAVSQMTGGVVPGAAPATAPSAATGNAAEIAKSTGVPILSGTRSNDKQWELYDAWVASGRKGNPVARPGTSKHETGNAIDVDMKRATPEQISALKAKGFTQPLPEKDPNHWELVAAPATNAPLPSTAGAQAAATPGAAAPAVNQIRPLPEPPKVTPLAPPQVTAAAPAAPVAATPAAPQAPIRPIAEKTMPELRAEQEANAAYQKEAATGAGKTLTKQQEDFEASINPVNVIEKRAANKRIIDLVMGSPTSVGLLQKPGMGAALATLAKNGVNTPSGAIGVKEVEDALMLMMPGVDQKAINARNEIKQNLARGELEASKLGQGQGSVSDFERELFKKVSGSTADTPELLIKRQQALLARENLNEKLGVAYGDYQASGKPPNLADFKRSTAFRDLIKEYDKELTGILNSEINIPKSDNAKPVAGKTPGGITFKVITPAKTQ